MIPPSGTINDAIGLLAALSDPDRTKAALDEMKQHSEIAQEALAKARETTVAGNATAVANAASADKLGRERVAFVEEKARHDAEWADRVRGLDDRAAAIFFKEKELVLLQSKLDADTSKLSDREMAVVHDRKILDAATASLSEREKKLAETLDTLGPIAKKLGLDA